MILQALPPEENFLALDESLCGFQKAQAVILPVPYEETTTLGKGTRHGPEAVLRISPHLEDFDDELNVEPCSVGIATLPAVEFEDATGEEALGLLQARALQVYHTGKFLVALGGEHTITVGLVRGACEVFDNLSVLQLDAHTDLYPEYNGSRLNHACVMARVNELCPFVGVGLRSGLRDDGRDLRVESRLFYASEMVRDPDWPEKAIDALTDNVYLTIDLDFFDPSVMPAVGTPEPGGFLWYETLEFLRMVFQRKNVVACDVVELSPIPGILHPQMFAAKLVYKLIGYRFFARLVSI